MSFYDNAKRTVIFFWGISCWSMQNLAILLIIVVVDLLAT